MDRLMFPLLVLICSVFSRTEAQLPKAAETGWRAYHLPSAYFRAEPAFKAAGKGMGGIPGFMRVQSSNFGIHLTEACWDIREYLNTLFRINIPSEAEVVFDEEKNLLFVVAPQENLELLDSLFFNSILCRPTDVDVELSVVEYSLRDRFDLKNRASVDALHAAAQSWRVIDKIQMRVGANGPKKISTVKKNTPRSAASKSKKKAIDNGDIAGEGQLKPSEFGTEVEMDATIDLDSRTIDFSLAYKHRSKIGSNGKNLELKHSSSFESLDGQSSILQIETVTVPPTDDSSSFKEVAVILKADVASPKSGDLQALAKLWRKSDQEAVEREPNMKASPGDETQLSQAEAMELRAFYFRSTLEPNSNGHVNEWQSKRSYRRASEARFDWCGLLEDQYGIHIPPSAKVIYDVWQHLVVARAPRATIDRVWTQLLDDTLHAPAGGVDVAISVFEYSLEKPLGTESETSFEALRTAAKSWRMLEMTQMRAGAYQFSNFSSTMKNSERHVASDSENAGVIDEDDAVSDSIQPGESGTILGVESSAYRNGEKGSLGIDYKHRSQAGSDGQKLPFRIRKQLEFTTGVPVILEMKPISSGSENGIFPRKERAVVLMANIVNMDDKYIRELVKQSYRMHNQESQVNKNSESSVEKPASE